MTRLGGQIAYLPGQGGAAFRVTVPLARADGAGLTALRFGVNAVVNRLGYCREPAAPAAPGRDQWRPRRRAISSGARPAPGARPPEIAAMSPEKAMRLAFGRAGRAGCRAGPAADRVRDGADHARRPDRGRARTALVVTLTRGDGATGALVLDAGIRAAVLEAQTMGRVSRAAPPTGPPPGSTR